MPRKSNRSPRSAARKENVQNAPSCACSPTSITKQRRNSSEPPCGLKTTTIDLIRHPQFSTLWLRNHIRISTRSVQLFARSVQKAEVDDLTALMGWVMFEVSL